MTTYKEYQILVDISNYWDRNILDKNIKDSKVFCNICLDNLTGKNRIQINPCGHSEFCSTCYYQMVRNKMSKCPLCRSNIDNFVYV